MKVWSWRHAIEQSNLKPITKLLLYTLANYMNEHGKGCYPTIPTIEKGTGLKERSIYMHLDAAEKAGFLVRKKRYKAGKEWAANSYEAAYPKEIKTQDIGLHEDAPQENEPEDQEVHGDASQEPQGVHEDAVKGCMEVQTNSPINSPISLSNTEVIEDGQKEREKKIKKIEKILGGQPLNLECLDFWEAKGADFDYHIIPAIRETVDKSGGKKIFSLKYFTANVEQLIKTKPITEKPRLPTNDREKKVNRVGFLHWRRKRGDFLNSGELSELEAFELEKGEVTWISFDDYCKQKEVLC